MSHLIPSPIVPPHHARLSEQLRQIMLGLQKHTAAHASKRWSIAPLVMLLWAYANRVVIRFNWLLARVARQRPPRTGPRTDRTNTKPQERKPQLPRGDAWLLPLVPMVAIFGHQISFLLKDPDMAALVEAEPGVRRILNPLLRMLGEPLIPPAPTAATPQAQAQPEPAPRATQPLEPAPPWPPSRPESPASAAPDPSPPPPLSKPA